MQAKNLLGAKRTAKQRYPRTPHVVPAAAISLGVGVIAALASMRNAKRPLPVVQSLDIGRYLGRWYEIAAYPNRFERGCVATTATYSRLDSGQLKVVNQCREGGFAGKVRTVEGTAWMEDPANPAKLKVRFFWPFSGDYWVVALDEDYRWSIVGEPSRQYLWILARTPTLDSAVYAGLLELVSSMGYDPARLRQSPQVPA
ncbi:MAG: lipocalin family protein [Betaproteobacteria bacterium]